MKLFFLILTLSLSACLAPAETKMPDYFVMLTEITPNPWLRCSGVALDQWTVLTADHCLRRGTFRIETQYGQSSLAYVYERFPQSDLALIKSIFPLSLSEYALLDVANTSLPAFLFGVCPQHFAHVPRPIHFSNADWFTNDNVSCEKWIVQSTVCGSDSGGFLVQNNKMIGLTIAVRSWWPNSRTVEGREVCVVPAKTIMETISWQTYNN